MPKEFSFQEGDQFQWERFISAEDVKRFAEVVGDLNPIHLDAEFAEGSFFKKRIVHGAFLGGLISKVLGMDFPGQGTVYIGSDDEMVYALDGATGAERWRFRTYGMVHACPADVKGHFVVSHQM